MPSALQALLWLIAAFLLNQFVVSPRSSPTLIFLSRVCLTLSLIVAPWVLKGIIVVALPVIPSCLRLQSTAQTPCSPLCAARANCSLIKT